MPFTFEAQEGMHMRQVSDVDPDDDIPTQVPDPTGLSLQEMLLKGAGGVFDEVVDRLLKAGEDTPSSNPLEP
jgi:hypothetical protein